MNKNKHLISKYLAGELDAITAVRFEEDLRKNADLRKELEFHKEINEALADKEVMALRMQLREINTQFAPETYISSKPKYRRATRIAVAASLMVILGFSAINLLRLNSTQKLVEKYYQPYELTSTNRSGSSDEDLVLRNALEKYQAREYSEAVVLFEKVLEKDPDQMGTQLYSGISNFEIAEYKKAGKSFTKVIEHNDNLYIAQAKWYLGFCYLKTEEKDKAIKQFTEIAESNSFYSEKAKAILKKLR